MNKKDEPSLSDLGLDQPTPSPPGKISIERLQRESEDEIVSHQGSVAQTAAVAGENVLGIVGFVLSILGLVTLGCVSPISLILCFIALGKKPIGLAVAGLVLSAIGCIGIAIYIAVFVIGIAIGQ